MRTCRSLLAAALALSAAAAFAGAAIANHQATTGTKNVAVRSVTTKPPRTSG